MLTVPCLADYLLGFLKILLTFENQLQSFSAFSFESAHKGDQKVQTFPLKRGMKMKFVPPLFMIYSQTALVS